MKRTVILLLLVFFWLGANASAEQKEITADYTFELSENDTRNDARHFCFLQAKRKLLESVHYYLQKSAYGDDYWFDQDDINIYADILLKIEAGEPVWRWEENKLYLTLTLKTMVDTGYIGRNLKELSEDKQLSEKIKQDRLQLRKYEEEYEATYRQLAGESGNKPLKLRTKRQAASQQMDELAKIKYLIDSKTKIAADKIQTGMTMDEVIAAAGQPRATATCEYPDFLNYGNIWIMLRNGIVVAKLPMEQWSGACRDYGQTSATPAKTEDEKQVRAAHEGEENRYEITLKGGKKILTPNCERIDDVIYYKRYEGIIGIEAGKVEKIRKLE